MSSPEVSRLRRLTNEPADDSDYGDTDLQDILDLTGRMYKAAGQVWREKAAKMADLVNTTEGSSSRQWSKAYEQALAMGREFDRLADEEQESEEPSKGQGTVQMRRIIRT